MFWCGDFNYRIDLPNAQTKELVKDKAWSELMSNDQLLIQKAEGKVCQGEKIILPTIFPHRFYCIHCNHLQMLHSS